MSGPLSDRIRRLVRISAALGSRDAVRIREVLESAVDHDPAIEVEEILVQSYLFLGFPAALNALAVWRDRSGRPAPAPTDVGGKGWTERGEEVCRRVYGASYPGLRRNIAALHPDMDRWMVTEGYGKVLGRDAVPLETRELCVAALLVALDAPVQLHSHLRGSLELGWSPETVEEVVRVAGELASDGARARAWEVLARVRSRRDHRAGES